MAAPHLTAFSPPGGSRRPFPRFSRFDEFLHLSLTRGVCLTSCSGEGSLDECGLPCDTLFCLLFPALWLRCNPSILVRETQPAKDIDLTCFKTFPITAVTCLQVPVGDRILFKHNRRCCQILKEWNGFGLFRRHAMYCLEHQRPCWICFLQTRNGEVKLKSQKDSLTPTTSMSPRSTWKGRVFSGYSGVDSSISIFSYFYS